MATIQLAPPYPVFTDKNGDPLDNGYLYFGVVDLNPETNPIQVYYDSAFTQPVAQPIRTSNGYPMRNGAPALIFAGSQFSVTVRDKNSDLVIYSPVGYGILPGTSVSSTDQMTYNEGSTSAVNRVLTSRLQDFVSVKDFGAVGNGTTNDTTAIQNAINAVSTAGGGVVFFPEGSYACANLIPKNNVTLQGSGSAATILLNNSAIYSVITTWTLAPGSSGAAITAYVAAAPRTTNFHVKDMGINGRYAINPDGGDDNHQHGVYLFKTTSCSVKNCKIQNVWYVGVESYYDCFDNEIHSNTFVNVGNLPTIVAPTGLYYGVGVDNGSTRCSVKWNYFDVCGHAINMIVDFFAGDDVVIESNTFGTLGGVFFTHRNGAKRLVVKDNRGDTCGSGFISISADAGLNAGGGYCENPTITGNHCKNFNTSNGASVAGIVMNANGHKIVRGNRISHTVTAAVRGCIGINMNGSAPSGSSTSEVEENYLEGNFPNYQALRFNAEANFVERNNFVNGLGTAQGEYVDGSCSSGKVGDGTRFIAVGSKVQNNSSTVKVFGYRQSYTPVVTAGSGGFSLGNGTTSGEYVWASDDTVTVDGTITIGSTTSFGTGILLISLPIPSSGAEEVGTFAYFRSSDLSGFCRVRSDGKIDLYAPTAVSGIAPVAMASTDVLKFIVTYKVNI